ncbi:hypothetical protein [Burkholderia sp. LMU1-1-1.1]|uniref:hypothetical protein n=1 Tax=Burkholderia sp. LMU1-1-1.1 TaxID=3135266 RepID=UPI0034171CB0
MTTVRNVNPAAQEQAAMHRTELLLARCRNCTLPRALAAGPLSRWHEQRQAHFLAWLEAGGFAQSDPERHQPERERAAHALRDGGPAADPHADADPAMLRPIENSGIAPLFSVP